MARKSKKKRGDRPPGYDPNEARRQRLEARRAAKAAELEAAARRARRARVLRIIVYAGLLTSLIWFFVLRDRGPKEFNGHELVGASTTGVGEHVPPYNYDLRPPVSGSHAPQPLACGVHGTQIPDENMVHMLEHGAVGIQYDPAVVTPEDIKKIEAIVGRYDENVYSTPYSGMETPIVVSSWGEYMPLDELDEEAIEQYIDDLAGEGPERGQTCAGGADEPFEASPGPSPSPEFPPPTASPEPTASE